VNAAFGLTVGGLTTTSFGVLTAEPMAVLAGVMAKVALQEERLFPSPVSWADGGLFPFVSRDAAEVESRYRAFLHSKCFQ
jgi:hypothetical protein